jgi:hypothetical protein
VTPHLTNAGLIKDKIKFHSILLRIKIPSRAGFLSVIPPAIPPEAIQDELRALWLAAQNFFPATKWRDRTPLSICISVLDNVP